MQSLLLAAALACFDLFASRAVAAPAIPMCITVDDLPAAGAEHPWLSRTETADLIIASLVRERVPEVYGFVNGALAAGMAARLDILRAWKRAGFLIGNHTYEHVDLSRVSAQAFIADLEKNESTLIDFADSIAELKWLRYPYLQEGETAEKRYAVRHYLSQRAYRIAPVTVNFDDWAWVSPFTRCTAKGDDVALADLARTYLGHALARLHYADALAKFIFGDRRVLKHVLLIHMNAFTARMLDRLLAAYVAAGVRWIGFAEAMTEPAFSEDTTYIDALGADFLGQSLVTRKLTFAELAYPQTPKHWLDGLCR